MPAEPLADYVIRTHAAIAMARRGIDRDEVHTVLANPEQRIVVRAGRDVFQSRMKLPGRAVLIRVFVDIDRHPAEVVTAYRTSKIEKYWRPSV
ncbi:MAG TPA: DUF4258 domain-containing protein [Chloroflexota bacterium]|nr:DUF4258 domain-containing protein [Chloroflexota bacterium]